MPAGDVEEAASRFEAKASFWRQRLESAGRLTPSRGPDSPADSSDGGSARSGQESWHTPLGAAAAGERSPPGAACQPGERVQAAIEAAAELGEQSP